MIRSLYLVGVYMTFVCLGMTAPFVMTLGYVWTDTFRPQEVAYIVLNQLPVAMIMAVLALGSYFAMDRRSPPRLRAPVVMILILAAWCTLTLLWAESLDDALPKWNWAVKTLLFAAFLPYVIRSRVHIEAFIQTLIFSLAANLIPFGAKVALSGGGYGRSLGLGSNNSGLAEGATLAAVAIMTLPLLLHLRRHSILAPKSFVLRQIYLALAAVAVITTIGTYERTGLVGLVVFGVYMFVKTRRKVAFAACAGVVAFAIAILTSSAWNDRISTIIDPAGKPGSESRLLVWQWTLNYAMQHPLGGGFNSYVINRIEFDNGEVQYARAFHSIYFEVLGEQGWVGLALFLGIAGTSFFALRRARRAIQDIAEMEWCVDLIASLQVSIVVLLACGSFVGIAFQPWLYYMFATAISVSEYVRRVTAPDVPVRARAEIGAQPQTGLLGAIRPASVVHSERPASGALRTSSARMAWRPGTSR